MRNLSICSCEHLLFCMHMKLQSTHMHGATACLTITYHVRVYCLYRMTATEYYVWLMYTAHIYAHPMYVLYVGWQQQNTSVADVQHTLYAHPMYVLSVGWQQQNTSVADVQHTLYSHPMYVLYVGWQQQNICVADVQQFWQAVVVQGKTPNLY